MPRDDDQPKKKPTPRTSQARKPLTKLQALRRQQHDHVLLRSTPATIARLLPARAALLAEAEHLLIQAKRKATRAERTAKFTLTILAQPQALLRIETHQLDGGPRVKALDEAVLAGRPCPLEAWPALRTLIFLRAEESVRRRDCGRAFQLLLGIQIRHEDAFGRHSLPAIAFAARSAAFFRRHHLMPGALLFLERLQLMLCQRMAIHDERMRRTWQLTARCAWHAQRGPLAVVAHFHAWIIGLKNKTRAPEVRHLTRISQFYLNRGDFAAAAYFSLTAWEIAEAYGFGATFVGRDARALAEEVLGGPVRSAPSAD